jgi:hypothetical protein
LARQNARHRPGADQPSSSKHDRFDQSTISTTIVAAITSNLRLSACPGTSVFDAVKLGFVRKRRKRLAHWPLFWN